MKGVLIMKFGFKWAVVICMFMGVQFGSNAQENRTRYLGGNIPPAVRSAIELGVEQNMHPKLSYSVYAGYLINTDQDSWIKVGSTLDFSRKSGAYLKLGTRFNWRKSLNRYAFYFGGNLVPALAIEEGRTQVVGDFINIPVSAVSKRSYNLGGNVEIGFTSSATRRLNFDVGFQYGYVLIDNMVDLHSFMPGMGVNRGRGRRFQPVLRVKYRLGNFTCSRQLPE